MANWSCTAQRARLWCFISVLKWCVRPRVDGCVLISILSAHGGAFRYHAIDFNVSLLQFPQDLAVLTLFSRAISGGADPHVHLFKRDPQMLDHIFMSHSELNLSGGDMYEVSSFDDRCTIGTF